MEGFPYEPTTRLRPLRRFWRQRRNVARNSRGAGQCTKPDGKTSGSGSGKVLRVLRSQSRRRRQDRHNEEFHYNGDPNPDAGVGGIAEASTSIRLEAVMVRYRRDFESHISDDSTRDWF